MPRERVRELNDGFRATFEGGRVLMTRGVQALPKEVITTAFERMQTFTEFTEDNDPYGEHDFGSFEVGGSRFFWKIDYYNEDMTAGSEDPANPEITTRVLTLMLAHEY